MSTKYNYQMGITHLNKNHLNEAEDYFTKVCDDPVYKIKALKHLVTIAQRKGRYDVARDLLDSVQNQKRKIN